MRICNQLRFKLLEGICIVVILKFLNPISKQSFKEFYWVTLRILLQIESARPKWIKWYYFGHWIIFGNLLDFIYLLRYFAHISLGLTSKMTNKTLAIKQWLENHILIAYILAIIAESYYLSLFRSLCLNFFCARLSYTSSGYN